VQCVCVCVCVELDEKSSMVLGTHTLCLLLMLQGADGDRLGFPPFLGGPFRYVDAVGAATIVDTLHRLRCVLPLPFALESIQSLTYSHTHTPSLVVSAGTSTASASRRRRCWSTWPRAAKSSTPTKRGRERGSEGLGRTAGRMRARVRAHVGGRETGRERERGVPDRAPAANTHRVSHVSHTTYTYSGHVVNAKKHGRERG
jgi:hypothetical protein